MAMLREDYAAEHGVQPDVATKWWKVQAAEEPAPVLRFSLPLLTRGHGRQVRSPAHWYR